MINGKRVAVVMPAYNAEKTIKRTFGEIPQGAADKLILVDDCSTDQTAVVSRKLGIRTIVHDKNTGYGGNQKTCYREALKDGADIIVMLHPDYQYDPRVIPFAAGLLATGVCDIVLGSRIRTRYETLKDGMPLYKYLSNRFLTLVENIVLGQNIGDFHSGFRAYTREVLEKINYKQNSNDFVFDTEFLAQAVFHKFRIGDIPIPVRYFPEASMINFSRSLKYGIQTLGVMHKYILQKSGLVDYKIFMKSPPKNNGLGN